MLFLWQLCEDGKCWLTVEQATLELSKLSGVVAKCAAIKLQIAIWAKGFSFSEYHVTWSSHGAVHSIEHLQSYLIFIIIDVRNSRKQIIKPGVQAPRKEELPVLCIETIHVRHKEKKTHRIKRTLQT